MISFNTFDVKMPDFPRRIISSWIKVIVQQYQKKAGEIAYIFCSDRKIIELNNEYLFHDYFTDVITFDYSNKNMISGDIFISIDTVLSNSEKFMVSYENELFRVMIHGVLHLCGFKDSTNEERIKMENLENSALHVLSKIY